MRIKHSYLKNALIGLHIIFAAIGFYTFLFNYQLTEKVLVQKTLNKQIILAKAGSTAVENLLKNVQNQLSSFIFSFTRIPETAHFDIQNTRSEFDAYMQRAQLPVNGVALYDAAGQLLILANRKHVHTGEGQNFSQTAYIHWSKNPANKGKTYISTPYVGTTGASIGKIIILLAQPIYFGSAYQGTLTIKLLVDDFRNDFVNTLISDSDETSFVVSQDGVLLAGNQELLNQNLFTYAQKAKWPRFKDFSAKLNTALHASATQTAWTFQNPLERPVDSFVGISKIDIPSSDKDLYMVVTTARESVLSSLTPLRVYGFAWLGFGVLTTALGGLIVIALQARD